MSIAITYPGLNGLDRYNKNDLRWMIILQWFALITMIIDHSGSQLLKPGMLQDITGFIGIAMPIMAYCMAQGAELTRDWRKYALRVLVIASLGQFFWAGAGFNPYILNDVYSLFLGLVSIQLEKRQRFLGLLVVALAFMGPLPGLPVLSVWVCWKNLKNQFNIAIYYLILSIILSQLVSMVWITWGVVGFIILFLPYFKAPALPRKKYLTYAVYPLHLGVLCFVNIIIK